MMDGFLFSESRYVNSHIDYEALKKENTYIERAFILPGDRLSVYKYATNRGLINFNDNKSHNAVITITDAYKNKSTLSFRIKSQILTAPSIGKSVDQNTVVMPYGKNNKFTSEDVSLIIPEGTLYDTLNFLYRKEKGTKEMLSDLHYIHNSLTPLQKAITLSIKPTAIPAGKESKMLLIRLDEDHNESAIKSIWTNSYLTADVLAFGKYYAGIDTIPPVISGNGLLNNDNLSGRKEIRIRIKDELSGIKSYEPLIDGQWALFEYDQKYDLLTYKFDETRVNSGMKHELVLKVTDNKDNTSTFKCNFTW